MGIGKVMVDLVDAVTKVFGSALRDRVATALNVAPAVVDKLVSGGVPALLAAIHGRTREPGGARLLASVLERQPASLIDNMSDAVGTPRQTSVVEDGISTIGTMLGARAVGELSGTLSKFAGTGIGNARNSLGILMPAVVGVLGREQSARKLDAGGLANLLASQHQSIATALPAAMRPLLDDTALLEGFDAAERTRPPASMPATSSANAPAFGRAAPRNPDFSWPSWIAAIAAASVMWWSVFGERVLGIVTGTPPPAVASRLVGTPERIMLGTRDLGAEAAETLAHINGLLTGIRGDVTARLSLPKLVESSAALDRLRNQSGQLTPDRRRQFAALVSGRTAELAAAITAAEAAPGAAPILRPALTELRARLAALAK